MRNFAAKLRKRFQNTNDPSGKPYPTTKGGKGLEPRATLSDGQTDKDLIMYKKSDLLEPVKSFREVASDKKRPLLIKKLRLCSVVFDFNNESAKENLGKEMKRQILLELVDFVSTNKGWCDERVMLEILDMVAANVFRGLPPSMHANENWDPEEDEPTLDPAWPHLQIVYEILLRFIVSSEPDPKLLKKQLNGQFILSLLDVFKSEDPREREYLKTILHRIYGKFMSLRSFVRNAINNVFYQVIYESDRHNGISELLEILGSIINGFALPLKAQHKKFLRNVLIPLHKVPRLNIFHQQLAYCVTQFIDKDTTLSNVVIGGLLKFWPTTSPAKEVLFLNELEEVLELTPAPQLNLMMKPVFQRLGLCIGSSHFQVSERALFLWNTEFIATLTSDHKVTIFPYIVPPLHQNSKSHWNVTVHSLTLNVVKLLMEIDTNLFQQIANESEAKDPQEEIRQSQWNKIIAHCDTSK